MDALSATLEDISNRRARKEPEKKMEAIRTSLPSVEASISKFENIIEECRMMEGKVCQTAEETASQDQPDSGNDVAEDVEMTDQEVVPQLESSDSHMEVSTEDQPPSASGGGLVSPEEDAILMGATAQPENRSPASETTLVSGELAGLQLASPPHPEPEEEETPT